MTKSILETLLEKMNKEWEPYLKKLEKEKDEIKKLKLINKIREIDLSVTLKEFKKLTDNQWEKFVDELTEPIGKQSKLLEEKVDRLVHKRSKDPKEYKLYEKQKKVESDSLEKIFGIIENANLNKKSLERYLLLIFIRLFMLENTQLENNLRFYEFNQARNVVNQRLGFDYEWIVYLSLIQLHENLIKKKIEELKGEIKEEESIRSLISKLANLIKEKEKREVSLALLLSTGVKSARDIMTHEGYKHQVLKKDLEDLFAEILKLDQILYLHIEE